MSQPCRAGLKFGYRPYGPRSYSRSIFEFPRRLFSALAVSFSAACLSLIENVHQLRVLSQRQECSTIG
jgi:hypothetical protein